MESGCLRVSEGTRCLIHPRISGLRLTSPSGPEGPWMMCGWAVPSTCPPSPPARRRVPFKCPGAGARSRGWRCGCRSTRAHRSPHTSQMTVQSQRRRRTSKGRVSSGSRLPAAPKAPGATTKVGLGAAGKGRRVEREWSPFGGAWIAGTLIRAAAGLLVSPRPHTQEC